MNLNPNRRTGFSLPSRLLFSRDNFETRKKLALEFAKETARKANRGKRKKTPIPKSLSPDAMRELRAHSAAIECTNVLEHRIPMQVRKKLTDALSGYLWQSDPKEKKDYAKIAEKLIGKSEAGRRLLLAEVLHHASLEPPEILSRHPATGRKIHATVFWPGLAHSAFSVLEHSVSVASGYFVEMESAERKEFMEDLMRAAAAQAIAARFPSNNQNKLFAVQILLSDRLYGVPQEFSFRKKIGKFGLGKYAQEIGSSQLEGLHETARFLYKALHFDK